MLKFIDRNGVFGTAFHFTHHDTYCRTGTTLRLNTQFATAGSYLAIANVSMQLCSMAQLQAFKYLHSQSAFVIWNYLKTSVKFFGYPILANVRFYIYYFYPPALH